MRSYCKFDKINQQYVTGVHVTEQEMLFALTEDKVLPLIRHQISEKLADRVMETLGPAIDLAIKRLADEAKEADSK